MRRFLPLALFGIVLSCTMVPARGSDRASITQPSVEDMVRSLEPSPPITRSLATPTRNLIPSLDLTVHFAFNSAVLEEEGKALLNRLATALSDERLRVLRFRIEGHTDAQGSAVYNLHLSARRAQSVAQYLRSQGIDIQRLEPVGKGFTELLDDRLPASAVNRRVRIVTLP